MPLDTNTLKNYLLALIKSLLIFFIFSTNLVWAESKPQLLDYLPIKMVEMIEQFPHTFELSMACFDYPKINIQACEKLAEVDHPGSAFAKHNLGISYAEGKEGFTQSHSEAFYWYLRAANQGLDSSLHNLARMYEFGHGVEVSHAMAVSLYLRAHDQGCKKSMGRAGVLTLVSMNQAEEQGLLPYEEKIKFMSYLKPWQIEEAYAYFE